MSSPKETVEQRDKRRAAEEEAFRSKKDARQRDITMRLAAVIKAEEDDKRSKLILESNVRKRARENAGHWSALKGKNRPMPSRFLKKVTVNLHRGALGVALQQARPRGPCRRLRSSARTRRTHARAHA